MDRFLKLIIARPALTLLVVLGVTGLSLWQARLLKFDISVFSVFDNDDPMIDEIRKLDESFDLDEFGEIIVVGFEDPDVFSPQGLATIEKISRALEQAAPGDKVFSLTRMPDLSSAEGLLGGRRLVESTDLRAEPAARIKALALANPLIKNQLVSAEGRAAAVMVRLSYGGLGNADVAQSHLKTVAAIRDAVEKLESELGRPLYLSGPPVIGDEVARQLKSDMRFFFGLCLFIMLFVLYYVFRNPWGVILPNVAVLGAVAWTLGLMATTGESISMVNSSLPALVMVIGVADSIHILERYAEELRGGLPKFEALLRAFRHIGVAIFLTSITSAIGFLSLATSTSKAVQSMGEYASVGIMFAFIMTLTFIPSTLALLSEKAAPRAGRQGDLFDRALAGFSHLVSRHPGKVLLSGLLVVALSGVGVSLLKTDSRMLQELKPKSRFALATRFIEDHLGGVLQLMITVDAPPGTSALDPSVMGPMWKLHEQVAASPIVGSVTGLASYLAVINGAFIGKIEAPETTKMIGQYFFLMEEAEDQFSPYAWIDEDHTRLRSIVRIHDVQKADLDELVSMIREEGARLLPPGSKVHVSGDTLFARKVTGSIVRDLVKSLLLAFVFIFAVVVVMFRSFRLGVLTLAPNVLPLFICMGVMGLTGISLRVATAMIFAIALGIAVDNTIHFINRYRVEKLKGRSPEQAVTTTLATTGRAILQTNVLLIAGLLALLAGTFRATTHFAILSSTIYVSAVYASLLLLPAGVIVVARRLDQNGKSTKK